MKNTLRENLNATVEEAKEQIRKGNNRRALMDLAFVVSVLIDQLPITQPEPVGDNG